MAKHDTCLTAHDAKLLVRFLDAVDDLVTERFGMGFRPREEHLTSLLCEMLDDRMAKRHNLSFSHSQLQCELEKDPKKLRVNISIETCEYPASTENLLTSSDIGVIVKYDDHHVTEASFERGILFQAKKLFPSDFDPATKYKLSNRFQSLDW